MQSGIFTRLREKFQIPPNETIIQNKNEYFWFTCIGARTRIALSKRRVRFVEHSMMQFKELFCPLRYCCRKTVIE